MAWTEEAAMTANLYESVPEDVTIWDSGATFWDVSGGNVVHTYWDYIPFTTVWSEESGV